MTDQQELSNVETKRKIRKTINRVLRIYEAIPGHLTFIFPESQRERERSTVGKKKKRYLKK